MRITTGQKLSIFFLKMLTKFIKKSSLHKIESFHVLYTIIFDRLKPTSVIIFGNKMFLPQRDRIITSELILNGGWEQFETKLFKENVNHGDFIVDLGAHIGYYTLIAAKLVGEKGKVFAFEPDPNNFSLLKRNVEYNGYKNVILINKAVSDKNGNVKLYLSNENTGDHRIYDSGNKRDYINVNKTSLNNFFKDKKIKIDLIKMDVQGSEVKALKGMSNIIKNNNIKLFAEFWPLGLKLAGNNIKEYVNLLNKYKFKSYQIMEEKKKIKRISSKELLKLSGNTFYPDLFCTKN